jgi:hypothetical protein
MRMGSRRHNIFGDETRRLKCFTKVDVGVDIGLVSKLFRLSL